MLGWSTVPFLKTRCCIPAIARRPYVMGLRSRGTLRAPAISADAGARLDLIPAVAVLPLQAEDRLPVVHSPFSALSRASSRTKAAADAGSARYWRFVPATREQGGAPPSVRRTLDMPWTRARGSPLRTGSMPRRTILQTFSALRQERSSGSLPHSCRGQRGRDHPRQGAWPLSRGRLRANRVAPAPKQPSRPSLQSIASWQPRRHFRGADGAPSTRPARHSFIR